jgi:electron transport complex protein RnfG
MNIKKEFITPIIVLMCICFFMSGALAVVNSITEPVIQAADAVRAAEAKAEIMPLAEGFDLLPLEGLPRTIREVNRATNGIGFIFLVAVNGYGGEMRFLIGVEPAGRVIKSKVLSHSETIAFFNRVFPNRSDLYEGREISEIEGIEAITGATITSDALKTAMRDALTAFEIVRSH